MTIRLLAFYAMETISLANILINSFLTNLIGRLISSYDGTIGRLF